MTDLNEIYIIAIFFLIVLSAIFSCCETSITAVSRAKIHRLIREGNKKAKKIDKLLKKKDRVISSLLLGNNIVNILASALATSIFIKIFGETGLLYATIAMTLLILIFAEITPKAFAIKAPDKMILLFSPIVLFFVKTFSPITETIQVIVNSFIGLFFGKSKSSKLEELEEIRNAVALKAVEGLIFKYDKNLLDGVLDLSETNIEEIMIYRKDIFSLDYNLPKDKIIKKALASSYTRIPLWKGTKENIVAILNVKKLLLELQKNQDFKLENICTPPRFVPSTNKLRSQLIQFRKNEERIAIVIDEYGLIQGLITLEDIIEEIVGDISETNKRLPSKIVKTSGDYYKVSGKILIRDLNKNLNWNLEETDDAFNLSGYIISRLGYIPRQKEKFQINNYEFQILKSNNSDLETLKIKNLNKIGD